MPKVLFVVHGMGDNLPGWSSRWVDFLDMALSLYPRFEGEQHPFRDRVAVEELCYDPVFDKTLAEWGRSRDELTNWLGNNNLSLDGTLNQLASQQLEVEAEGFVWETLLDPVLYRGSPIIRDKVREVVTRQFVEKWDAHLRRETGTKKLEVSVLCHSQGTIVMTDVLATVGEARLPELVPFSAEKRSIECLTTLANVSRLGPGPLIDIDSRSSCCRPQTAPPWKAGKANYLKRFINARNRFDPFCLWQRFEPKESWGGRYRFIEVDHVHQANTHGATHYLANPKVHIPFFRGVLGADEISEEDEQDALEAFPSIMPPSCEHAVGTLQLAMEALGGGAVNDASSLDGWITRGLTFYEAVRDATKACNELVEGLDD